MSKYDAKLKRIRRALKPPDTSGDPLQFAILDEMASWLREHPDENRPLKDRPESVTEAMIQACVGRGLVNAGLSPEEIEQRVPAYEDLFRRYNADLKEASRQPRYPWGVG